MTRPTPSVWCRPCGVYHPKYQHRNGEHHLAKWCPLCEAYHFTKGYPDYCVVQERNFFTHNQGENMTDIEARKKVLQQQIDRAADELALLQKMEEYGDADFSDGTVIRWQTNKPRPDGRAVYGLAMKIGDYWHHLGVRETNGPNNFTVTVDKIVREARGEVEIATGWKSVGSDQGE